MVVLRGLGWLLLALAVSTVVHDGLAWAAEGTLRLLTFGDLWAHLDLGSFSAAQIALQRGATSVLWFWVARPLLAIPVLPAFVALGALLQPMFETVQANGGTKPREGMFGGGAGEEMWRPMFVQAVARQMAGHGGLGLAMPVFNQMLRMQEQQQGDGA